MTRQAAGLRFAAACAGIAASAGCVFSGAAVNRAILPPPREMRAVEPAPDSPGQQRIQTGMSREEILKRWGKPYLIAGCGMEETWSYEVFVENRGVVNGFGRTTSWKLEFPFNTLWSIRREVLAGPPPGDGPMTALRERWKQLVDECLKAQGLAG